MLSAGCHFVDGVVCVFHVQPENTARIASSVAVDVFNGQLGLPYASKASNSGMHAYHCPCTRSQALGQFAQFLLPTHKEAAGSVGHAGTFGQWSDWGNFLRLLAFGFAILFQETLEVFWPVIFIWPQSGQQLLETICVAIFTAVCVAKIDPRDSGNTSRYFAGRIEDGK